MYSTLFKRAANVKKMTDEAYEDVLVGNSTYQELSSKKLNFTQETNNAVVDHKNLENDDL